MGKFANFEKMIELGMQGWQRATEEGLTRIRVAGHVGNRVETTDGHLFLNMVSCSYLGLDRHPKIIEGAIEAVAEAGTMLVPVSRARIGLALIDEVEAAISDLFRCEAVITLSCYTASAGVLPVVASGHLTGGKKPVMIFDKKSHFSMNAMKATCGDETEVLTCEHNDVDFVADACRKWPTVAYVADGAYSLGGNAPVPELRELQDRYGLLLYLDDSHSISVYGPRGVGFVRSQLDDMPDRTIIVASLGKAFGAAGGLVMLADRKQRNLVDFVAGPLGWSQTANAAALGAIRSSAAIHLSEELDALQAQLRARLDYFDEVIPTVNAGNGLPIRVIDLPTMDRAVEASAEIYRRGFYTSAVFFPIVARGRAGLRAMGRADIEEADIRAFCETLSDVIGMAA